MLQNGQLSYYRHQSEEGKASRGTIVMNHARVSGPSASGQGDPNKFEISSEVAKFRFFVKADHPLEAIRWVEDLKAHIDYASGNLQRRKSTSETLQRTGSSFRTPSLGMTQVPEADESRTHLSSSPEGNFTPNVIPPTPTRGDKTPSHHDPAQGDETATRSSLSASASLPGALTRRLSTSTLKKFIPGKHTPSSLSNMASANDSSISIPRSTDESISSSMALGSSASSVPPQDDPIDAGSIISFGNEDSMNGAKKPPHEENFVLLENSAKAQIEACEQLINVIDVDTTSTDERQEDVRDALKQGIKKVKALYDEYVEHTKDREHWYCRRYEQEIEARRLWEDNLAHLAKQQAELESELQKEAQKGNRRKKELRNLQARSRTPSLASPPATGRIQPPLAEAGKEISEQEESEHAGRDRSDTITAATIAGASTGAAAGASTAAVSDENANVDDDDSSDDDDDEFFEAVDSGQLEMSVDPPLTEPPSAVFHEKDLPEAIKEKIAEKDLVYAGYKHPRTELPIGVDDRPDVSLWSILKNSIGKDLTKISFPVSFVSDFVKSIAVVITDFGDLSRMSLPACCSVWRKIWNFQRSSTPQLCIKTPQSASLLLLLLQCPTIRPLSVVSPSPSTQC